MVLQDISEQGKSMADGVAGISIIASIMGWLPNFAIILTVLYGIFRLYDLFLAIKIKRKTLKDDA